MESVQISETNFWGPESTAILVILLSIVVIRTFGQNRLKNLQGERVITLSALNDVTMFKEVFLAYLNAAMLEPVLGIGGMEEFKAEEFVINILELGSICWWIWLVTDAFDFQDITQHFKYHIELKDENDKDTNRFPWLRLKAVEDDAQTERQSLVGSLRKDIALWFMFAAIAAAWLPGIVSHRDVMHAYFVVILWIVLHHGCRRATAWTSSYFVTFLFPSTALMPLEYCLPLMDVADAVENLDFLVRYRAYVKERTGVEIIIES